MQNNLAQAPELITIILAHLPANDLHHAELVCKEWRGLCVKTLWRVLFLNTYHGIYQQATARQCELKYEMAKNLVPILEGVHCIFYDLDKDEFFSCLKKSATRPYVLLNKNATKLPLPRVLDVKQLFQYDAKRHLQMDVKHPNPYKKYSINGKQMTIIQPFSEATLHDIIVTKKHKDCYIRACTSSFMLFAYAMRLCNQIGFVDLLAKEQIMTFVPFDIGVIESIKLVHDWNVMYLEKKKYPQTTHFAAYRFFACGSRKGLPYLQEYLIVDKKEKDQPKFDCSYTMVHDYVTPAMAGSFRTVDYDVDNDVMTASTSDAMYIFQNRQLKAVVGNTTLPNVPCFAVPNLTTILTCKCCVIVKKTVLELKLVTSDDPSMMHRVLFDMSCNTFTHIYSIKLTSAGTYRHYENQHGFSDSGAYLWFNVDHNNHNDLILEYRLHTLHANTMQFYEDYSDKFEFESSSTFAWEYYICHIGCFEGDYMYYRDHILTYHQVGKEPIRVENPLVSRDVLKDRIGEKRGNRENRMGHLTMYGICIQLEECWFRLNANESLPNTYSNLIRYW